MSAAEPPWAGSADTGSATAAVHVTRELPARREEVFRAWTDPELFARWFKPPGNSSVRAELDVRPGGDYRIRLERTQLVPGTSYIVGRYLEVDPPERLVFTFGWEEPPPLAGIGGLEELDSRVTVQFRDRGESTEISITHERLETEGLRAFHRWGWETTLEELAARGTEGPPEKTLPHPSGRPPVLWHLKVSHYNEKARWALDYKRIPHVRRAATPGSHAKIARGLWAGRTFPVLEMDGEAIGDSTFIIRELERRYPEPPLYPDDPADRRRALELEDFFDEELGPHLRLLVLEHMLPDPALLLGAFAPDLSAPRRWTARAIYPLIRRGVSRGFGIDRERVDRAWEKCRAACERLAAERGGSGYLVGEQFTVADLTVAALLSPVIAPLQFPYPQPQRDHPRMADMRRMLDERGALEWALGIYEHHRPRSMEVAASR